MARLQRGDAVVDIWLESEVAGARLQVREGKRPLVRAPIESTFAARNGYVKLIKERLLAGWHRVPDPERELVGDDEPREPALEAALARDPGDAATALVYADWYQQQEHPRGSLIAVQHALALRPGDPALVAEERKLFADWPEWLLGPIGVPRVDYHLGLDLRWEHGFVCAARLDGKGDRGDGEDLLWELLRHPSARFLRELVIGCHQFGDQDNQLMTSILLNAGPTPPLRSLVLADFDDTHLDNIDISRAPLGDLSLLGERYPALEDVVLKGRGDVELGELRLPRARRFAIRTSSLTRRTLAAILEAPWPELRELELWFGSDEYGAECGVDDLAALLAGDRVPQLHTLRLMNASFTDELCKVLVTSPLVHRLEVLDLALGTLSDAGAAQLIAGRDALTRLRTLGVHDCSLTADGLARLHAAGLPIVEGAPFPGAGWHQTTVARRGGQKIDRYVSVSE